VAVAAALLCGCKSEGADVPAWTPPPQQSPSTKRDAASDASPSAPALDAAGTADLAGPVDASVAPDVVDHDGTALTGDGSSDAAPGDGTFGVSVLDQPLGPLPTSLRDVGLFPRFPDLTAADPRALYFEPRHQLYSNRLTKQRYAVLPRGEKINTTTRDAWDFPVGTLFFKTFFQDPGPGNRSRPVETRIIRRVSVSGLPQQQWEFGVWHWNDEGTDATLVVDPQFRNDIAKTVTAGGQMGSHNIPKRSGCWNCHVASASTIIGFDELRLNHTLAGKQQTQLDEVIARGWLSAVPAQPHAQVSDPSMMQRQVLEYLHGNCAHCHNGEQQLREPGLRYPLLDLRWNRALASTIGIRTMTNATAQGFRIVRGRPTESVLFLAVEGSMNSAMNTEVKPMPPVGVQEPDRAAISLLRQWIGSLPPR
jgi:hypothetical protein